MIPFTKPRIEDLVSKEIVLTNLKDWTNKGTIWTPNQTDHGFLYRLFGNCIGQIPLDEGDLRHLRGNLFYYSTGKHAVMVYSGGMNPYSNSETPHPHYEKLSAFLDQAMLKGG